MQPTPHSNEITISKGASLGTIIGIILGTAAWAWYKMNQVPQDNKMFDTGTKTTDGKPIIEVTGIGGEDNGIKVKGYILPSKIEEIKLPLTVIVMPNKNLFLKFKSGDKVTFESKFNDELKWRDNKGDEYVIWLPDLIKSALGTI